MHMHHEETEGHPFRCQAQNVTENTGLRIILKQRLQ